MTDSPPTEPLRRTPLHALHLRLGARTAPFAGYEMPIQYPAGILQEHLHTRAAAGLFDVSHMGQARLTGKNAAKRLESLVPGDIQALEPGRTRYTQFLDGEGNILDDLMATRLATTAGDEEALFLVVNAGCKAQDFALLQAALPDLELTILEDRALIAVQGPRAAAAFARVIPGFEAAPFMSMREADWRGATLFVSRSGYTGEDGYEISVPAALAEDFAATLLADPNVKPIGLGARDSLRLEAGLCLYGRDIDATTTPVEAGLLWSISKRRRAEGGFPGAARVQAQIAQGPARKRVGIRPEGKAPAREGTEILSEGGALIGRITSGGYGPSVGGPMAMGYVESAHAAPGTRLSLMVRGKALPAAVAPLPFVPARFYRGA
ncbi:MAG: glycine cleavage system aminomethyltransferase GcvT [Methylobacteriaceae bacterium]|nr:glycine cleavage system aminomethyltransferase GcvT [Methylobacteriaceae bacterium]